MTAALFSAYLLPLATGVATVATPVQFFCEVIPKHTDAIRAALEEAGLRVESLVRIAAMPGNQIIFAQ